ncbi:hypothetical protein GWK47_029974 [Chionoecetes opilio]|uniref:Uncharacterized protein n=1 Tax=Chionoecetes opilio TaxID=41210 RepID=A0A8J4YS29_CHIOP|nr:hypothetical protein GWK47_029974 [Chionoecetes opilio]
MAQNARVGGGSGIPKDIVVPHCADALHFSLQASSPVTPLLTVGNVSLALSHLSPAQPRLRLTVKSTPGVAPRVVSVDVWRTVVEVGSASSTFSLSSPKDTFTLLQHLHLQEGQAETQDCRETVQVHHNNTLTIADDHNNTWVNTSIRSSTRYLQVTVNHLSSSCITQTPVWEVEGGIPKDIVVPHCADALHFSLQASSPVTPLLTIGNVSLALSHLSPAQPRLRLTVKSTPGVAPRVVSVDVWRTVVEVGSASSTFSLSSPKDTFTLLQHLHLQEGQAETQDCRETVQAAQFGAFPAGFLCMNSPAQPAALLQAHFTSSLTAFAAAGCELQTGTQDFVSASVSNRSLQQLVSVVGPGDRLSNAP